MVDESLERRPSNRAALDIHERQRSELFTGREGPLGVRQKGKKLAGQTD